MRGDASVPPWRVALSCCRGCRYTRHHVAPRNTSAILQARHARPHRPRAPRGPRRGRSSEAGRSSQSTPARLWFLCGVGGGKKLQIVFATPRRAQRASLPPTRVFGPQSCCYKLVPGCKLHAHFAPPAARCLRGARTRPWVVLRLVQHGPHTPRPPCLSALLRLSNCATMRAAAGAKF